MNEPSTAEALAWTIAATAIIEYAEASPKRRKEILAASRSVIHSVATLVTLAKEANVE